MDSKQQTMNGLLAGFHDRLDLMMPMGKRAPSFQPTELDLALAHNPATAAHRALLAASQEETTPMPNPADEEDHQPAASLGQANREGQRETAAASLAGGMIAAEGRPVSAAEAVKKVQEVLKELKRRE